MKKNIITFLIIGGILTIWTCTKKSERVFNNSSDPQFEGYNKKQFVVKVVDESIDSILPISQALPNPFIKIVEKLSLKFPQAFFKLGRGDFYKLFS